MPGPPPPPPAAPPPMAPPPPMFAPSKGGVDNRSALLSSIRQGTKLKKTVTVDKSAPMISGKVSGANNNSNSSSNYSSSSPSVTQNGLGLGGLFAGGMPKLRPTGIIGPNNFNSSTSNNNNSSHSSSGSGSANSSVPHRPDVPLPPKNYNSIQNELKKQLASDNKNRGPPPPAPVRNMPDDSYKPRHTFASKVNSNGFNSSQTSFNTSNLQINHSTLHRKVKSNTNLSSLESVHTMNAQNQINKPVINHGKPNLAPKPPPLNGKPTAPPKRLITNGKAIHRAQSMKSPRSPSPQSPDSALNAVKFGTVRNLSSVIGQSLANSTGNLSSYKQRPALNGRPTAPPPSVPPQQPPPTPPQSSSSPSIPLPPSKTNIVKPPTEAPPPPPSHAPPPPPHRTQPMRPPPAIPSSNAPPPPRRLSSMTSTKKTSPLVSEFEFKPMSSFPAPDTYRNVTKVYSNRQASKQQAPQPPQLQVTSGSRSWDTSASC